MSRTDGVTSNVACTPQKDEAEADVPRNWLANWHPGVDRVGVRVGVGVESSKYLYEARRHCTVASAEWNPAHVGFYMKPPTSKVWYEKPIALEMEDGDVTLTRRAKQGSVRCCFHPWIICTSPRAQG
ncbi:Uu.00g109860.m01.CDS01 [Anthostomella pinea]|uniref:Uu.00g109860.m01.CDS01 n=1 Tax=Anthostomella pinea TaxID=933095 RepID=A0AAI8VEP5_9PEZI|nr:Uu.00g109860.m01.CDS01 [Anthostomella pinea]